MKIVHVMPQIGIGGAETQLWTLIVNSRANADHEVLYYADSLDTAGLRLYESAGISLKRVPRSRRRPLQFTRDLSREIGRRSPDIVHCWLSGGAFWGRLAAIWAGLPHIIIAYRGTSLLHVRFLRVIEKATEARVYRYANSRACARCVAGQLGLRPEQFHVIYNGVELDGEVVSGCRSALLSELGLPDETILIANVGRLTASKNHDMLFQVAVRCSDLPTAHFVLAGHGEREAELRAMVRTLGLADRVHFLGLRRDIRAILGASDLFCYTSLHEGFPNALLEAMAAGLPIVTTDFAGADELVEDGCSGVIVPMNDADAMVAAVRAYIAEPDRARLFGGSAAGVARDRFSVPRMVEETLAFYRRILASQS